MFREITITLNALRTAVKNKDDAAILRLAKKYTKIADELSSSR